MDVYPTALRLDDAEVRAVVFLFREEVEVLSTGPNHVFAHVLLDLPGLLFFTTYTLLVLFWAEIYHQARGLPTDNLRPYFMAANVGVYVLQAAIWGVMWFDHKDMLTIDLIAKLFFTAVSLAAAAGFLLYGGRLFLMLRQFPIESRGRRKKLHEVGFVTLICFSCFIVRAAVIAYSAIVSTAWLDVVADPWVNVAYYAVSPTPFPCTHMPLHRTHMPLHRTHTPVVSRSSPNWLDVVADPWVNVAYYAVRATPFPRTHMPLHCTHTPVVSQSSPNWLDVVADPWVNVAYYAQPHIVAAAAHVSSAGMIQLSSPCSFSPLSPYLLSLSASALFPSLASLFLCVLFLVCVHASSSVCMPPRLCACLLVCVHASSSVCMPPRLRACLLVCVHASSSACMPPRLCACLLVCVHASSFSPSVCTSSPSRLLPYSQFPSHPVLSPSPVRGAHPSSPGALHSAQAASLPPDVMPPSPPSSPSSPCSPSFLAHQCVELIPAALLLYIPCCHLTS
ncbi:unnamed protein product [Closterium sp. Naga37s-1]|nr:unnamed protein product [Closterium sp. Naga37s-1]